jgi:secernin
LCDSFVALAEATATGSVYLAKNADTEINEAQHVVAFPACDYREGAQVRLTHRLIPQARHTHAILLNKSWWTFGAEIGLNEHGLAVGNEAVWTNQHSKGEGIIVIDFLRLIVERARTCDEAVDLVATLLGEFGQGGNCEMRGNSHFDGSYLVSDAQGAVVIETAGYHWAARRVQGFGSISNVLGIRDDWDRSSIQGDNCEQDWRARFCVEEKSLAAGSNERQKASESFLAQHAGTITVRTMADLVRYTGEGDYDPIQGDRPTRICMHAGPHPDRLWQATGSMITDTRQDSVIAWITGTSGPDVSIFKPAFVGIDLPDMGPMPRETYTQGSLWWRHETLQRRAMADYRNIVPDIRADFEALETGFFADAETARSGSSIEKRDFVAECWRLADEATQRWIKTLAARTYRIDNPAYRAMWDEMNAAASFMP